MQLSGSFNDTVILGGHCIRVVFILFVEMRKFCLQNAFTLNAFSISLPNNGTVAGT